MADHTPGSTPPPLSLPDAPDLDWLRKQAKRRVRELRRTNPDATLAQAQLDLARRYGFASWRALKAHVDSQSAEGRLFAAARTGDIDTLIALLAEDPARLRARAKPHGHTLLHLAAREGHLPVVDHLLRRGLDANLREPGDETYAMHWAAAAGHLAVVRRLAEAGGDVVGRGDDHELEVIGWATCWDGCDDDAHRAVVAFLLERGAKHHIFSAIAMNLGDEVRRIVAADPAALAKPMSRHENHQLPLHFAVRMNRPEMVELLMSLGADPTAVDALGTPAIVYAAEATVDRRIVETLASRGALDLFAALVLGDEAAAARRLAEDSSGIDASGVLHRLAKMGDARAVRWLLDRGADPNARWNHWDAEVTPLHLAASRGHATIVRMLLDAGADPSIRDSKHDGDAAGWAQYGMVPPPRAWPEIVQMLEAHPRGS